MLPWIKKKTGKDESREWFIQLCMANTGEACPNISKGPSDILKVDFFARSKLNFSNFAQEKVEKYH